MQKWRNVRVNEKPIGAICAPTILSLNKARRAVQDLKEVRQPLARTGAVRRGLAGRSNYVRSRLPVHSCLSSCRRLRTSGDGRTRFRFRSLKPSKSYFRADTFCQGLLMTTASALAGTHSQHCIAGRKGSSVSAISAALPFHQRVSACTLGAGASTQGITQQWIIMYSMKDMDPFWCSSSPCSMHARPRHTIVHEGSVVALLHQLQRPPELAEVVVVLVAIYTCMGPTPHISRLPLHLLGASQLKRTTG